MRPWRAVTACLGRLQISADAVIAGTCCHQRIPLLTWRAFKPCVSAETDTGESGSVYSQAVVQRHLCAHVHGYLQQ